MMEDTSTVLLDLPWEDVLCRKVLICLPTVEVCRLKFVNKNFKLLVETYFCLCRKIDLSISGGKTNFSGKHFEELTQHSESLRELNLRTCKKWLQDKYLIPLLSRNVSLRIIDLSGCLDITNEVVKELASTCKGLQELTLRECRWLSSDALRMVGLECQNLQVMVLTGCWNINNDCLCIVFANNASLEHVDIGDCYGIDEITVSYMAKNCRRIRYLGIKGCWRVTNDSIRTVREYCKCLRELKVKDCKNVTEASLALLRAHDVIIDVPKPLFVQRPMAGFGFEEQFGISRPILNLQI